MGKRTEAYTIVLELKNIEGLIPPLFTLPLLKDIAVQFCFFDIQLTRLSTRIVSLQKCLFEYQGIPVCSVSENVLVQSQNPWMPVSMLNGTFRLDFFWNDLDQRKPLAELHKPPTSVDHLRMPFSHPSDRLEKTSLCCVGRQTNPTVPSEQTGAI
ncbi:hypothetical protein Tco_1492787 [Tanacetum coccineum]|uniref:Uncharacterized protein n=1 Tax=Tanacetum coccineum TaxID=301880 RepID=A0ABQ5IKD7_9ASTR